MYPDVVDLRGFYARPLGRVARRLIGHQIRGVWPNVTGMAVAGFGYATPYLQPFVGEATRVIGLMPAQQGVDRWPEEGLNLTTLVQEDHLPLSDESIDRIVLIHSVESSEALRELLRQVWRVLAPGGRVLIVAPNRRGFWARRETTPFGHGRPFTRTQLRDLLRGAMFTPTLWRSCLFMPPFGAKPFLKSAVAWERFGHMAGRRFAGVIMVEAAKEIYSATPVGIKGGVRRRLVAPAQIVSRQSVTEQMQSATMDSSVLSHPINKGLNK
ncbi:MAG: class I SAM-dependent methyltransferase [Rhodobiaceae bacterium]|nr:class I SAM-dependent methyltransferase [Rhodobiaceae bacterium]